eukprot:3408777-Pyramimonas_sp.AAC.1
MESYYGRSGSWIYERLYIRHDWVLEQRRRKGMRGTTLSEVLGLFGERHELASAANSGTIK